MKIMALETDYAKEFKNFRKRFIGLEEKSQKNEMRCLMLEIEVENLKKKNQELEGQIATIQKVIVDSTDVANDDENLHELMVENKVLECEKRKAETELCFWKEKCKELESNMKGMNEKFEEDINVISNGSNKVFHSQVRRLPLEEDRCPNKKMAPSTAGVVHSSFQNISDVSDEDVTYNEIPTIEEVSGSIKCGNLAKCQCSFKNDLQGNLEHVDEEHTDDFKFNSSSTRSAKRKRAAKIVDSDDEDSDNALICTLKTQHSSRILTNLEEEIKENVSRRHLPRQRKFGSKNKQDKSSIDLNKTFSSSEEEEDEPVSEGESLGGFIVDSSESVSKCDSESGDSADESEDVLNDYKVTIENIGRKKSWNLKWDLEGDMLSDFAKDPELCMRAVCALYRQQTDDEKDCKGTIHQNERGFSQPDAYSGCELAEFLIDGDPYGDLNKTVEELKEYDVEGIEQCKKFAKKYSKQLFTIYHNKEDPYFLPK